jgi:hypothetical protein
VKPTLTLCAIQASFRPVLGQLILGKRLTGKRADRETDLAVDQGVRKDSLPALDGRPAEALLGRGPVQRVSRSQGADDAQINDAEHWFLHRDRGGGVGQQ